MVINSDSDDSTTAKPTDDQKPRNRYRPQFLEHFERKNAGDARSDDKATATEYSPAAAEQQQQQQQQLQQEKPHLASGANDITNWEHNMEMQFQQISAINQYGLQQHQQQQHVLMAYPLMDEQLIALNNQQNLLRSNAPQAIGQQGIPPAAAPAAPAQPPPAYQNQHMHTQSHAYVEGEFEFLKFLTFDDLTQRLSNIDHEMELEIEQLNKKYNAKRQPIVDAMNAKRKRQQNINNNLIKI